MDVHRRADRPRDPAAFAADASRGNPYPPRVVRRIFGRRDHRGAAAGNATAGDRAAARWHHVRRGRTPACARGVSDSARSRAHGYPESHRGAVTRAIRRRTDLAGGTDRATRLCRSDPPHPRTSPDRRTTCSHPDPTRNIAAATAPRHPGEGRQLRRALQRSAATAISRRNQQHAGPAWATRRLVSPTRPQPAGFGRGHPQIRLPGGVPG